MTTPYFKPPFGIPNSFAFPNALSRDVLALRTAFSVNGLEIADTQHEMHGMWVWVLCTNGELWLLDKSHGGGGMFQRESK